MELSDLKNLVLILLPLLSGLSLGLLVAWTPRVGYLQALQRSSQIVIQYEVYVEKWEKHTSM